MDNQVVISGCPPEFLVVRKLPQFEKQLFVTNNWSECSKFVKNYSCIFTNLTGLSGLSKLICWKSRVLAVEFGCPPDN